MSTHRVYAIDLRGYGDSDRPGDYSFAAMRDDVLGMLDQIGAHRIHVIGHSLGGSIAWLIAQSQPDRVARLVIEARMRNSPMHGRRSSKLWHRSTTPNPRGGIDSTRSPRRSCCRLGGEPSHVPQHLFAEAQTMLKDARIAEIPVGHHIHRDALDRFLAVVVPFLTQPTAK